QVIQVVVADPAINRLDQAFGEPTVTVNGKKLRMTQNTDGNWYAYFADRDQAIEADKTSGLAGKGLDFGQFCSSTALATVNPLVSVNDGYTADVELQNCPKSSPFPARSDVLSASIAWSLSAKYAYQFPSVFCVILNFLPFTVTVGSPKAWSSLFMAGSATTTWIT